MYYMVDHKIYTGILSLLYVLHGRSQNDIPVYYYCYMYYMVDHKIYTGILSLLYVLHGRSQNIYRYIIIVICITW